MTEHESTQSVTVNSTLNLGPHLSVPEQEISPINPRFTERYKYCLILKKHFITFLKLAGKSSHLLQDLGELQRFAWHSTFISWHGYSCSTPLLYTVLLKMPEYTGKIYQHLSWSKTV